MKELLERIKTNLLLDGTLSTYIKTGAVQVVSPDVLPSIATSFLPFIGVAPLRSSTVWFSTARKDTTHLVRIFVVQKMEVQELAILGNSTKRGILEIIADVEPVVRAKMFPSSGVNYLSKPSEISDVSYSTMGYGDNLYTIVAQITLTCVRQISVSV